MSIEEIRKQENKVYIRCAAGFLTGIVLLAGFWKIQGLLSVIVGTAGIIIMLISLSIFSHAFNTFYKIKAILNTEAAGEEYKETYIEWPAWIKKWGGVIFTFIIFIGFNVFGSMHENDFGGLKFVWHSLLAGSLVAVGIIFVIRRIYSNWSVNKFGEVGFYVFLSVLFVFVCFGPIINRSFPLGPASCKQFSLVISNKPVKKKGKYIHVQTGNKKERFKPGNAFMKTLSGDERIVILCIRKGFLNYEYVEEFKLPEH
jgi:hypothetical protein